MENGHNISPVAVENKTQVDSVSADYRKLFVGDLHRESGEQDLRDHFGKYGEIEHINIKIDQITGRSRGFAFILFKSSAALSKVEEVVDHVINGRKVDPKKAKTRQGRIFVGGLSLDLTDEDIKTHFAQFGTIVEAHMPFDKIKNQRKRFCFIVFESDEVVKNLLKKPKQYIKGKEVDVKRAEPKLEQQGESMMVGRGGRGGMRGDRDSGGGYEMQNFNKQNFDDEQSYDYHESKLEQSRGSMLWGRGETRAARGSRGGYGMQGFNKQNFRNEQSYSNHESKPEQPDRSMMRGRGNRGYMRGGSGGRYEMQGYEKRNFSNQQVYNYHDSKPEQPSRSMMGDQRGRGGMRSARGSGRGHEMQVLNNQNFDHDQSYSYHESKPDQPGGSMMGARGSRGGMRGARGSGGGYEMQGFNKQNFGDEQAYNYHVSKPEQQVRSMMRGRGARGGIRGARGGYGQRYQPY